MKYGELLLHCIALLSIHLSILGRLIKATNGEFIENVFLLDYFKCRGPVCMED